MNPISSGHEDMEVSAGDVSRPLGGGCSSGVAGLGVCFFLASTGTYISCSAAVRWQSLSARGKYSLSSPCQHLAPCSLPSPTLPGCRRATGPSLSLAVRFKQAWHWGGCCWHGAGCGMAGRCWCWVGHDSEHAGPGVGADCTVQNVSADGVGRGLWAGCGRC